MAGETRPSALAHLPQSLEAEAPSKAAGQTQRALAPATEKIYADDWAAFSAWCAGQGAPRLPAAPSIVAAYLAARATTLGRSGLRVALAAIAHQYCRAGHSWNSGDPAIAAVMKDLQAQRRPVRPAAALTSVALGQLLASCGEDPGGRLGLAGLRDRALLLTCFAGGLRRSELVALDVHDIQITAGGMRLTLRQSKPGQDGEGGTVDVARSAQTCPVRAMEAWLRRSGLTYGAVFRRVTGAGTVENRLTGNGVWKILRRRAALAGLTVSEGERLSPHGLRAGCITEAYRNGTPDAQVMAQARQKDVATARRYRTRAKTVAAGPAKSFDH